MAIITPTLPGITGVVTTGAAAAAGGDSVAAATGNVFVIINNGGGGSINATFVAQNTARPADGTFPAMTLSSQVVAVAAGAVKIIGPFPPAFVDANGYVQVTYSGVTSVTIAAFKPS